MAVPKLCPVTFPPKAWCCRYKPDGNGQMTIKADVKTKEPALSRGTSLFFLTPEGNLTRRDPRQQDLPLRTVNDDKPDVLRQVSQ